MIRRMRETPGRRGAGRGETQRERERGRDGEGERDRGGEAERDTERVCVFGYFTVILVS